MPRPVHLLASSSGRAEPCRLQPLLLAIALASPAAGVEAMDPVMVGGIRVNPAGDLSDIEHRFEIHPKALIGGGWNSTPTVPPADDSGPDTYSRGLAGILLRYHPRPGLDAMLDAELERLAYSEHAELDTNAGLLRGGFDHVAPGLTWNGDAVWRRSQETLLTTGEQVAQDHSRFRTRFAHDSAYWWEDAALSMSHLDYRQGTSSFDKIEGDHTTYAADLRLGIAEGDDRGFLDVRSEVVRYAVDDRFNDCTSLTTTAGCVLMTTARSNLHLEAGMELRRYADDYLHDADNGDQLALAPWWDLGGTWSWREGDRLGARLFSDLTDSLTSNATWSMGGELSSHIELSSRLAVEAGVNLAETRDGGLNVASTAVQRRILQGSLAGQYAVSEGLAMRLRTTAVQVQADNGYDRLLISLDLAYVY
jgi:hypothetical protein